MNRGRAAAARDVRLIATDIDGTILPRGGAISENTRRAIARCWERGIPFIIATGRWVGAVAEVQAAAGLVGRPCIIANGGAVLDGDGSLLKEWITPEPLARRVCEAMAEYPVMVNTYVRNGLYRMNTAAMAGQVKKYVAEGDPRIVSDDPEAFWTAGQRNVYKLEALCDDRDVIEALRARLTDMGLSVSSASPRNLEIMAPGFGKGTVLRWLAGHLGVPIENTMAFGDYLNDLEMLRAAGWPVAMGNGVDELKAAARIIAPTDAEDGVARVVFERVLEEAL